MTYRSIISYCFLLCAAGCIVGCSGDDGSDDTDTDNGDSDTETETGTPLDTDWAYEWHTFYGSEGEDDGFSIASHDSAVYVTGRTEFTWTGPSGQSPLHEHSGEHDLFVLKLDSMGTYEWHTFYGSTDMAWGDGIAADENGVYVTGMSLSTWNGPSDQSPLNEHSGDREIVILALDTDGAYKWHAFYGSEFGDRGYGIIADGGHIYVAGESVDTWTGPSGQSPLWEPSGFWRFFIMKLGVDGAYGWHTFYGSTGTDRAYGIAMGSDGVYVTGQAGNTWTGPSGQDPLNPFHGTDDDMFVLKLDTDGAYQWHTFYGSTDSEWGDAITAGSSSIYVTGASWESWKGPSGQSPLNPFNGLDDDLFIVKLDPDGAYQWHTFYGSRLRDRSGSITADGDNVFVTGYSYASWLGPSGQRPLNAYNGATERAHNILIMKLDRSGAFQWHSFYGGGDIDRGAGITADQSGVYVVGESIGLWDGPSGQSPLNSFLGWYKILVMKLAKEQH